MAIQAPPHGKRLRLPGDRHFIDPAVTSHAGNAFVYMDAVIEIHVVGEIINASPLIGLPVWKLSRTCFRTGASFQICE
jgi:hypothetical protein